MGRRSGRATKRWRPGRFRAREPSQRGSARKKPVRRRGRTGRSLDAVAFEGTQRIAGPLHHLRGRERPHAGEPRGGAPPVLPPLQGRGARARGGADAGRAPPGANDDRSRPFRRSLDAAARRRGDKFVRIGAVRPERHVDRLASRPPRCQSARTARERPTCPPPRCAVRAAHWRPVPHAPGRGDERSRRSTLPRASGCRRSPGFLWADHAATVSAARERLGPPLLPCPFPGRSPSPLFRAAPSRIGAPGPDRRDVTNHQPRPSPPAERREGDFFRRRRTPEPRASALRSESGLSASGESVRPERRAGAPGPESKGGRKGPLQLRSRSPDLGATSARPVRPRRASPRPRRRRLAREEAPAPAHPSPAPGPMRSARR
jgi:hypothetical protein